MTTKQIEPVRSARGARMVTALLLTLVGTLAVGCETSPPPSSSPQTPPDLPHVAPLPADPEGPDGYAPLPGFEGMAIPHDNPLDARKAALGRDLFHDPRLSATLFFRGRRSPR
jgi:cytochrome c peroxidase